MLWKPDCVGRAGFDIDVLLHCFITLLMYFDCRQNTRESIVGNNSLILKRTTNNY